mgnify:CR=1 FL=1
MPEVKPEMEPQDVADRAVELGAAEARVISPQNVYTAEWVRLRCQYGCGGYGARLTCPPHAPEPSRTRKVLDAYRTAVLVHGDRKSSMRELIVEIERQAFLAGYYKAFGFASGPCRLCEQCPTDSTCRHPRQARPAMEASGIDVFRTAREAGFHIRVVKDRSEKPDFYGLVLLE